ncbi:MAG: hypothetical protein ABIR37_01540 [Candidatus Saccharimonadales bacterium]
MSETYDNVVLVNQGLQELDRMGHTHEILFSGRPTYEVYSLDPFARSNYYGRYFNRAPVIIGTVALKAILTAPTPYPDRLVMHVAFETGERMFGYPINYNKPGHRQVIHEVFENLGLHGWEIT